MRARRGPGFQLQLFAVFGRVRAKKMLQPSLIPLDLVRPVTPKVAGSSPVAPAIGSRDSAQQPYQLLAVGELLQVEDGIDERRLVLFRHRRTGELAKLGHNIVCGCKRLLAAARSFARFTFDCPVAQPHLDAHLVAERRAKRGDGGVVNDADPAGKLDAGAVFYGLRLELIDEDVALDEQRRNA